MRQDEVKTVRETKLCVVCKKEVDANEIVRVKIEDDKGYGIVYNVCPVCVKENNYTEYDGSDFMSDWN